MIKTVYDNQDDILDAIEKLHCKNGFVCDVTYGNGVFYKNRREPLFRFDNDPNLKNVTHASSDDLPFPDDIIENIVFDPPFLTYVRDGRNNNSIMGKRFSGYWSYDDLKNHYTRTIKECSRVLKQNGVLVVKCQDIIHNHQLYATHVNVVNWCYSYGLRPLDFYVLTAKNRIPVNKDSKQQHARIYHSYFLVFKKDNRMKGLDL